MSARSYERSPPGAGLRSGPPDRGRHARPARRHRRGQDDLPVGGGPTRYRTDWRPLMEPTRAVARRLVANGEVEVLQRGAVVDPSSVRGPIRIRRVPEVGPIR